jgi:sugar (pentulose or hexulose) kinase
MRPTPVIAIFDVGKTNKKCFLFNQSYQVVHEHTERLAETTDEDGHACEDLSCLRQFVFDSLQKLAALKQFELKAINFSAYGASFVYIDENGEPLTPLYNYLKPYPPKLQEQFYNAYGGQAAFSSRTASPVLGSLNSGMQLYRLKYERPELFKKIKHALHLPQYLAYLLSGKAYSDLTSIGCHTNLWDFENNNYHDWVRKEGIEKLLPPIVSYDHTTPGPNYVIGTGLHDSSAALIPYLINFTEPFVLISSGTWCISLNPFNNSLLTQEELSKDCLCYLQYKGLPVKASRLFAGQAHEDAVKKIAAHYNVSPFFYQKIEFDAALAAQLKKETGRDLLSFGNVKEAYHQVMIDIVRKQAAATKLVLNNPVKRIFVDGGFSNNPLYMHLLAAEFPQLKIYAASMSQATALGAALAVHSVWSEQSLPADIIRLHYYAASLQTVL